MNFLNGRGELESNIDSRDMQGTGLKNCNKVFTVGTVFSAIDVNCGDWIYDAISFKAFAKYYEPSYFVFPTVPVGIVFKLIF